MNREPIVGIYAGSFDPITRGHMGIICEALLKLDKLVILLAVNPDKSGAKFTIPERKELIQKAIGDFKAEIKNNPNATVVEKEALKRLEEGLVEIEIDAFQKADEMTIDYAIKHKSRQLIRGLRPIGDFEGEQTMADANRGLAEARDYAISTTFYPTPDPRFIFASSSIIRKLANEPKAIARYLYPSTAEAMADKERRNELVGPKPEKVSRL